MSDIIVRHLQTDVAQGFPRDWIAGDPFRTQLFNAMSMTFPLGEQFFIDSVREAAPAEMEPALRAQVRAFIGQEASHRQVHTLYNRELERQGLRFVVEPILQWRLRQSRALKKSSNLAITMAYEHYTAMLADGVLRNPQWMAHASDSMRLLWTWHAVEEAEHKAVAFDVYRAMGGGYARRVAWYLYTCIMFQFDISLQTLHNLKQSGNLFKLRTWTGAARFFFGRGGLAWHMLPQWFAYLRPGFTPWDCDNRAEINAWLAAHRSQLREIGAGTPA
ncbi:MAG TPA: metal-dependent hydrolase [Burkholderiaceae bacterium]